MIGWRGSMCAAVFGVAVLLLSACGDAATGDKVGAVTAPLTLRLGTDDGPERPGAKQVAHFAAEVAELSAGAITIEPVWQAAGDDGPREWDQLVARDVSGQLDMGMLPARAWDTEGVATLRAVHAPLLITSQELVERVVTDELATELLAGLEEVGVIGLALLPEGMRRLFLPSGSPPLTELEGKTVRSPRSATSYALLEAMGAVPDDPNGPEVDDLDIAAWESALDLSGTLPGGMTAAVDVALFPKLNSLVINREVWDGLDADLQEVLRRAAEGTLAWVVDDVVAEAAHAEAFCANGGRVVTADDEDMAVLERAAARVSEELQGDDTTRDLLARIEALAGPLAGHQEAIGPCGDDPAEALELLDEPGDVAAFPAGVYRMEISAEELVSRGVDQVTADNHAGVWTKTFRDAVLTILDVTALSGGVEEDEGVYCVAEGRVALGLIGDPPTCGDFFNARWTLEGDEFWFVDVRSDHGSDRLIEVLFGSKPWTKIG